MAAIKRTRLHDLGFPPAAMKLLLQAAKVVSRGARDHTGVIAPGVLGAGTPIEPLIEQIRSVLTDLLA